MWIFIAFLSPAFYGICSIYDSLLINKSFKNPMTLTFYASLFTVIFIPFLFLFYRFSLPSISFLPIFLLLGIINVSYLYPYYRGLQRDDTSTAISFFGLGRIFIPIWAFFIISEKLTPGEYIGIALVIAGSVLLSMQGSLKNIKFSKAILYILLASLITSFDGVLMKYLFEHGVSVGIGVAGEIFFSFLFTLLFLLHKKTRLDIVNNFSVFKSKFHLFFAEEAANFVAFFSGSFALSLAPVSLVRGIGVLTPFFVLAYAKVLDRKFPHLFNEQKGTGVTFKKVFLFSITALGVFLIAR
jgi:drug/metabolite transporter (DMT)-like permease